MKKYITSFVLAFVFGGCSYFTFNATMCDQIMSDPNAIVPQECRVYNEDEATKAFNNDKKSSFDSNDSVEFDK